MPRCRDSRLTVVSELKALSDEADRYVDEFPTDTAIDAWFSAVKQTFIRIRDCNCLQDIATDYPPDSSTIFGQERANKLVKPAVTETKIGHIHDDKNISDTKKNEAGESKIAKEVQITITPACQNEVNVANGTAKVLQKTPQAVFLSSNKKVIPEAMTSFPCTPKLKVAMPCKKNVLQGSSDHSEDVFYTPEMDKTFNKTTNFNSAHSSENSNHCRGVDTVDSSSSVKTRLSLKRKSSGGKDSSNKKQKTNVARNIPATTFTPGNKVLHPKHIIEKIGGLKPLIAENKTKLSAVIVPSLKLKMTPQPKEKLVLEEIKKKEEKANENRKRVLAERQMKVEENKKKREEKNEKTKQNRLKMEKEKEKHVMETVKSQAHKETAKKPGMKTRVKELIEQNAKENKSGSAGSLKQNDTSVDGFKTPAPKTSDDSDNFVNYDLTPIPDSSTYDFSDEEDKQPKKPIPSWAQGYYLKSALIAQYYNPPDADKIFGQDIDAPDLVAIFRVQKKRYKMRTSSAIWNTPPDRSIRY